MTAAHPPDADLIRRARAGDHDAYTVLVRRYEESVFRLAYLIAGDADDAQDIAQETFIRAHRQLHRFDLERPLRPWLLKIAANLARNQRRAWGRYTAALNRWRDHAPRTVASAERASLAAWESEDLRAALEQLSRTDREVIYLRTVLGVSVQETADILGVRPGTVKSRLSRALARLKEVVLADYPLLYEGRRP